jgi:hypothetical protein
VYLAAFFVRSHFPGRTPPLPGDKSFIFNGLRVVMACKKFITKGLRPNISE